MMINVKENDKRLVNDSVYKYLVTEVEYDTVNNTGLVKTGGRWPTGELKTRLDAYIRTLDPAEIKDKAIIMNDKSNTSISLKGSPNAVIHALFAIGTISSTTKKQFLEQIETHKRIDLKRARPIMDVIDADESVSKLVKEDPDLLLKVHEFYKNAMFSPTLSTPIEEQSNLNINKQMSI